MMALSIRQPWAWLIVEGHKAVENRKWATTKRGDVLVHAAGTLDRQAHEALCAGRHPVTGRPTKLGLIYPARSIEMGGIIGLVEIVACVTVSDDEWFVGPNGFVLRNPRRLRFQRCPGKLGFFEPMIEVDLCHDEPQGGGRLL